MIIPAAETRASQPEELSPVSDSPDGIGEEQSDDPSELLSAAFASDEVTAEELQAVDVSLDAMMLNESARHSINDKPLLSLEQAESKLSPDILKVLAEKFKGSLTEVRHPDERDQIF